MRYSTVALQYRCITLQMQCITFRMHDITDALQMRYRCSTRDDTSFHLLLYFFIFLHICTFFIFHIFQFFDIFDILTCFFFPFPCLFSFFYFFHLFHFFDILTYFSIFPFIIYFFAVSISAGCVDSHRDQSACELGFHFRTTCVSADPSQAWWRECVVACGSADP